MVESSDIVIGAREKFRGAVMRRTLVAFNWNLGFRGVYDAVCVVNGIVFVNFALALGVNKEEIGYFPALVSLACLLQLVGLLLTNYVRERKRYVLTLGFLEPLLLLLAIVAAVTLPAGSRFYLLALCIFLSAAALHLTRPTLDNWLASSIPAGIRGRYLGRRLQVVSLVLVLSTLLLGFVADHIPRHHAAGFAYLLALGTLFGLAAVMALRWADLPASCREARVHWTDLRAIGQERPFVRCVLAMTIYNLPFFLGAPFYTVFALEELHMRSSLVAFLLIGYYCIKVLFSQHLGRLVDRLGARHAIYLVTPLYLLFFLLYALSTPRTVWLIFLAWSIVSLADAVFTIAAMSALYRSIPETSARQTFFALYNQLLLLMTAVGAAAAASTMQALKGRTLTLGPWTFDHFHILYLSCFLLLIPCLFGTQLFPGRARAEANATGIPASR